MSSIGFPEIVPTNPVEIVVIMVVIFFGFLTFNMLLSAIASLIGSFNRDKQEFAARVNKMKQLIVSKSLPIEFHTKILLYYEYIWARYGGVNESEILSTLPPSLKSAVTSYLVGPFISPLPFFADCSDQLMTYLINLFQPRIFLHGDSIVTFGERGKEMFVIEKGNAQVCSENKKIIYTTLSRGSCIGESCLLAVSKRTASVFAVGYVDTYYITRAAFFKVP
jgi:hypothetical protein